MAITLSGVLKDPYGDPIANATIRFDAVRTSSTVVKTIRAEERAASNGSYSISVEEGRYNISVKQGQSLMVVAKNLEVRADSTAATLNDLLVEAQGEAEATPAIVLEFRTVADQVREDRNAAASSANAAASSASAASSSKSAAASSATSASQSATAASASKDAAASSASAANSSKTQAATSATSAGNSASSASTSATNAAGSASEAADSKTSAANSASAAASSASAANTSKTQAATSATNAANSAASVDAQKIVHTPGSGLPNAAGDIYSRNADEFVRTGQNSTIRTDGDTTLTISAKDSNNAMLAVYGDNQGTGRVYVGQDAVYGGGIEYNGDGSPVTTGAGNDYITLWRRSVGVDHWTARNLHNSNVWEFREPPRAGGGTVVDDSLATDWIDLPLLNGSVNYGNGYSKARYRRDALGFIHVVGLIHTKGATTYAELPAWARPDSQHIYLVQSGSGPFRVDVRSNGIIYSHNETINTWLSLSDIQPFYVGG